MTLLLVRHGSTDWSEAGRLNGATDVPLNTAGRRQALKLRELLDRAAFASVWTSDLARSVETAALSLGIGTRDPRLRELDFGELEGRTWAECPRDIQDALVAFDGFVAPGGESVAALRVRVFDFLSGLGVGDHLLFTHGGVIRLLLRAAGRDESVRPGEFVMIEGVPEEMPQGG